MFIRKDIVTEKETCIAMGRDVDDTTQAIFLRPVLSSCELGQRCFKRYTPLTECDVSISISVVIFGLKTFLFSIRINREMNPGVVVLYVYPHLVGIQPPCTMTVKESVASRKLEDTPACDTLLPLSSRQ